MRIIAAVLCVALLAGYTASAQMTVAQAMARLRQKQLAREKAERAHDRALPRASGPASQPATPDALAAIKAFTQSMHEVLGARKRDQAKLDASFAQLLDHPFRLSGIAEGVTKAVPIGDKGLFGDRPNEAVVMSFALPRSEQVERLWQQSGASPANRPLAPKAELYLVTSDDFMAQISNGQRMRGRVTFTRAEVDPAEWRYQTQRAIYAGGVRLLGIFTSTVPPEPLADRPAGHSAPARPNPLAPVMRSSPLASAMTLGGARRVIFVCDASGSMLNKFSTVRRALSNAVQQLRPSQSFNIVFFQDQTKPGFVALSKYRVTATPENKLMVDRWLGTVIPRGSTNPIPGLEYAFREFPDVIYLLTDGDFPNNRAVLDCVRQLDADRHVRINTIAFVGDSDTDTEFLALLKRIAAETGGSYHHVRESDL